MSRPAKNSLIVSQFNVENLFLFMDHYNGEDIQNLNEHQWQKLSGANVSNKELNKLKALAKSILDMDPDILMLNEVGGLESLNNFNHYFLKGQFESYLIEGNSDRGIDVGYLLKKDLGYKVVHLTHRERPLDFHYAHEEPGRKTYYFSRDISELRLFAPEEHSPRFIFLLGHLKSKLDPHGLDPLGNARRRAELKALIEIYQEVQEEVGSSASIIVGGDFNGVASPEDTEEPFQLIYDNTDLQEVFALKGLEPNKRFTQVQILPGRPIQHLQIDYLFVSKSLAANVLEASAYRFKDEWGEPLDAPTRLEDRSRLPSDHYPTVMKLQV